MKDIHYDISDEQILSVLRERKGGVMTYVIRNVLSPGRPHLGTTQIRRALQRMEKAGLVRRVSSVYAAQICWSLIDGVSP